MMSVKKMVDLYVTYELSEETWNMMRKMCLHGLISRDNWSKFFEKCHDWQFTEDGDRIEDSTGKVFYIRNADGYMVKAA